MVASKTREGRVLKVLLNKLERIRKELKSDKVFDIIGQQFSGRPLQDLILQAVVEGRAGREDCPGAGMSARRGRGEHTGGRLCPTPEGRLRPEGAAYRWLCPLRRGERTQWHASHRDDGQRVGPGRQPPRSLLALRGVRLRHNAHALPGA
jgi:hypothetical protein